MDDHYISILKISYLVGETGFQYFLSIWVLKSYGVESNVQVISLGLSWLSFFKAMVDRIVFTRYLAPTTCQILGTWTEWLVIFMSSTVEVFAGFADESIPPWIPIVMAIVCFGSLGSFFLLGAILPNKIFGNIANLIYQIPYHYLQLYLTFLGYSSIYWGFMVVFFLQSYNVLMNYYLLLLFPQLDKSNIWPKIPYERQGSFDLCKQTNSTSNSNIFFADLIDLEDIHFYEWAWIFPLLNLLQLFLYFLQHKGEINIFGPSVTFHQYTAGQLSNSGTQENSNSEEIQGILSTIAFLKEPFFKFWEYFAVQSDDIPELATNDSIEVQGKNKYYTEIRD